MDDDSDDFFGTADTTLIEDRPLGLVVGPRARQIFGPKGELLWDELLILEAEHRREGRPAITFEDNDDPLSGPRP